VATRTPKRTYKVLVTALKMRRGKVVKRGSNPPITVYLPGDDGDWVRVV
jgi:hypothetical protein